MSNINFRMMKTSRLLKITLSIAILAFLSTNVLGQPTYPSGLEMGQTGDVDSVTAGVNIPYYVAPDPVLNPDYSSPYPDNSADLSQTEEWNWWTGVTGVGGSTVNQGTAGGDPDNDGPYIEVSWSSPSGNAPASDSIYVTERNSDVGCDGDTSALEVLVFNQPAFTPVDADNDLIELCGTQTYTVTLAEIVDNGVQTGNLKIQLDSITVDNVDPAAPRGGSTNNVRFSEDTVVTIPSPLNNDGNPETDVPLLTDYYVGVQNGEVTRYRFVFGNNTASGSSEDGISDQISRKSDYLNVAGSDPDSYPANSNVQSNDWTYYAATDGGNGTNINVVVYPAPNTGNIYYVPHNFDQ
jgi:hypothetical protein